jgi:hypothetical protein
MPTPVGGGRKSRWLQKSGKVMSALDHVSVVTAIVQQSRHAPLQQRHALFGQDSQA